ncbi:MAG: glutamate-1-semialdehyde 2,1-aminomutase [Deltaproteobacteria bacterium]|nr:glutamate-1-semialdehyde 2,1-aminomutase [Deltaproteobacteria bacterium]
MKLEKSIALFERASTHLVGGVNSPVRAFKGVGGTPLFLEKAKGAYVWDADGNKFIDYVQTWGPAILGHAHDDVVKAICDQAQLGTSFGAPCELEIELAELVQKAVPMAEKIRFVSSGTEATMSALRLARGVTGKDGIVKCEGCYHGHGDSLLVKAGSGVSTLGLPDSPGVPKGLAKHTYNVPYNDADALKTLLEETDGDIACVILEPVAGNMGCVPPQDGYLQKVRELCTEHGVLLIFDEVMTGFRVALGGAQSLFGVEADIVTFGKVIGGGLPVGAFAAKAEIMAALSPEGPIYQAGTLSGNPLAMAAGIATLTPLFAENLYKDLGARTKKLAEGLENAAKSVGLSACHTQVGSMFSCFLLAQIPQTFSDVKQTDINFFATFFWEMLKEGIYLAPSAYETGFMSLAHTDHDVETTLTAAQKAFAVAKESLK